jgi:hypothetical protein
MVQSTKDLDKQRHIRKKKSFQWMVDIMAEVQTQINKDSVDTDSDSDEDQLVIARYIAPVPCPPLAEMQAKRRSRFTKKHSQ